MSLGAVSTLALLALAGSGCSLLGVRAPLAANKPGGCTTSPDLPTVDALVAVAAVAAGVAVVATNPPPACESYPDGCFLDFSPLARGFGYGLLSWGVLSAISMTSGFMTIGECRSAMHQESTPPPLAGRPDPVCLRQRSEQLLRAQQIKDVQIRSEALVSIPECEPVQPERD